MINKEWKQNQEIESESNNPEIDEYIRGEVNKDSNSDNSILYNYNQN